MRTLTRTIITGLLGTIYGYGTSYSAYLVGIRDQGGTMADVDPISVSIMSWSAILGGLGSLMLLLAKPPSSGTLVEINDHNPLDVNLS